MESGDDWKFLETIWLTDGETSMKARVEYKVELAAPNPYSDTVSAQH